MGSDTRPILLDCSLLQVQPSEICALRIQEQEGVDGGVGVTIAIVAEADPLNVATADGP